MSKVVQVIEVDKRDTLIFKFDLTLGVEKLDEIAEKLSNIIECGVICLDDKCDLTTVINLKNKKG